METRIEASNKDVVADRKYRVTDVEANRSYIPKDVAESINRPVTDGDANRS